jgi:hypothetical protein
MFFCSGGPHNYGPFEGAALNFFGVEVGPVMMGDEKALGELGPEHRPRTARLGDWAVLARLGIRAGEMAGLLLEDLNWREGVLRLKQSKNGNPATLPSNRCKPFWRHPTSLPGGWDMKAH